MKRIDRQNIDLFFELLRRDLKAKYKSTAVGYLWSLLMPLAQTLIFYVVFSLFLRFPIPDYFLFLSIGFLVWQYFSNTLCLCAEVLSINGNLIKKTCAPRLIFVLSGAGGELVHLLVSFPVLLAIMLFCGRSISWTALLLFPVTLGGTVLFALGLGLIFAPINVYFRDLARILQIMLQIWFYATPIFYSISLVPEKYHILLMLNPMFFIVACWRDLFYENQSPVWYYGVTLLCGVAVFMAGLGFFRRHQDDLAEVL